jgi:hypothetical protein
MFLYVGINFFFINENKCLRIGSTSAAYPNRMTEAERLLIVHENCSRI